MNLDVETRIRLNKFQPRWYQKPILDAIENKDYRRVLVVFPRRAGKDITAFNLMLRQAIKVVGVYYYVFPTYSQAKKVIWDAITNAGEKFLDYIPSELIKQKNSQEMKISLINNSLIQLVGSDNIDSLVGTNPRGVVFSEYALQSPLAYQFLRPILLANDGWALFISTPRGRNHMYELYQIAKNSRDWWCSHLTVKETQHISIAEIEKERVEGIMSEDLIQQEYYCDFHIGIEGSYYSKYINKMRLNGQLTSVPWEPAHKVHTAWDLGVRDSTCIIFFQTIGTIVRIIDCYENSKEGLEHYITILRGKPYTYGRHFAPHDIRVRDFSLGITRWEKARQLGVTFDVADNIPIEDGIEAVRSTLSKTWIDEHNCDSVIKALENYRQEYDAKKRVYKPKPLHNEYSHMCFVGETNVLTDKGNIAIKDVAPGMLVKTPTGLKKVLKVHKRTTTKLCDINVSDTTLICTPEHSIFTQQGLVKSDSLRYNDNMEHYSFMRNLVWQKIYGYFSKVLGLKGFKRTILSQRTKGKRCLMAMFIDGMGDIMSEAQRQTTRTQMCTGQYGHTITETFRRVWRCTTRIITRATTTLKTSSLLTGLSISSIMQIYPERGRSRMSVKNNCELLTQKQRSGIEAKRGVCGTESMQKNRFLRCGASNIRRSVKSVARSIMAKLLGKSIAANTVKLKTGSTSDWIMRNVLVSFAKLYLAVTNIKSKKHAVKNVRTYCCRTPREVYDLTVEDDNCYYANNYLVSNSDAMRYLAVALPKTSDGLSSHDIDKNYRRAMYGEESLPDFFSDRKY